MATTTVLRKVGGSLMFAVPPSLLNALQLSVGAKVSLTINDGRLVIEPNARPRYSMAELLDASDYTQRAPEEEREWTNSPAMGNELI